MSGRVFFLSSHVCEGESGGGHGVIYRLYTANKKYHLLPEDTVYVFINCVVEDNDNPDKFVIQHDTQIQSGIRVAVKKYIPNFIRINNQKKRYERIRSYIEEVDKKYSFCESDIFICHDFRIAYVFVNRYPHLKCVYVHHMQGSVYFEWHSETGINSAPMKRFYDSLFCDICEKVDLLCFPSKGTEESLIDSEPELKESVESTERRYLYNGVDCPDIDSNSIVPWIQDVSGMDGYKFVTIAKLNAAKAVERIPQYLYGIKQKGIKFTWILVGNGVQSIAVKEQIEKYHLENEVIWKRDRVEQAELMQLLTVTDFYILLHRFSIFDLSTLEAMHYGNIPILTPVGGNKEVIIDGNGLMVSDFSDVSSFMDMINSGKVEMMRQKNVNIQTEMFGDKAFLQRYVDLCEKMFSDN